ncbi:TEA/ATTS domain family-domain-containing protein [Lactarius pseudohatsudake]|nr:TEA/ATTS domain family-domain-containing protein [Lactarius pseudohatsudake]
MPRSLPTATPPKARGKSTGNRSVRCIPGGNEAIWDEELNAALIEALNIYPPMGRQRIRPMNAGGSSNTSLGRCQLIQQYLMQKTGKNRTRKQISSRIQRLRRTHQDDPSMADALLVLPDFQLPIAPEMLVNLTDGNEGTTLPTSVIPKTPPLLGPASFESSPSPSPSAEQLGDSFRSSTSSLSIQANQLALRLFDSTDLRFSVSGDSESEVSVRRSDQENIWPCPALDLPDRTARALSRRRMTSGVADLRFQLDLPTAPSSFSESGYGFEASSLTLSGNEFPYLSCYSQTGDPITPLDQITHTPEFPPQVIRYDKRSACQQLRYSERDSVFFQPVACHSSLSQYETHPVSHLFPAASVYSSVKPSPFNTCRTQNYSFPSSPLASFHPSIEHSSPQPLPLGPESCRGSIQTTQDVTHLAHLPRRLSYSCDSALPLRASSVAYSYVSQEGSIASTLGGLELAPPAVIRPFFVSDFPYSAAGNSPHPPLAESATASHHDGTVSQ